MSKQGRPSNFAYSSPDHCGLELNALLEALLPHPREHTLKQSLPAGKNALKLKANIYALGRASSISHIPGAAAPFPTHQLHLLLSKDLNLCFFQALSAFDAMSPFLYVSGPTYESSKKGTRHDSVNKDDVCFLK